MNIVNPTLARMIQKKITDDAGCGEFGPAQLCATRWGDELRSAGKKSGSKELLSDAAVMLAFSHMGFENVDAALAVATKHSRKPGQKPLSIDRATDFIDSHDGCTNQELADGIALSLARVKSTEFALKLRDKDYWNDGQGKGGWHSPKHSKVSKVAR